MKIESLLDPELVKEISDSSTRIGDLQYELDNEKWILAGHVNGMWEEHKTIFGMVKEDYYAECSRVANLNRKRKLFGESGETLRRWCDVRDCYEPLAEELTKINFTVEEMLDAWSFDHLFRAKSLMSKGMINSPLKALKWALDNEASAEDMEQHFNNDRPSLRAGFVNWFNSFITKRLPKLELPREKAEEVSALVKRIIEVIR